MRIVNKSVFYQLPAGTIFSEYKPVVFNGKPVDYVEMSLIGNVDAKSSDDFTDILEEARTTGSSFDLDFDFFGRNGMYEEEQLYAVYESRDLAGLISALENCLKNTCKAD